MKKKIVATLLVLFMFGMNTLCVNATEAAASDLTVEEVATDLTIVEEVATEGEELSPAEEEVVPEIPIPVGNMVEVDVIDLSLHSEKTGTFTPVYTYANPFRGKDTSKGIVLEFYAKPTWEAKVLGTIFSIMGSGEYDGRLYFTPGSYLGYNSAGFGGYFDANLYDYKLVDDYIQDGAMIRIEINPNSFAVYADDVLCYDNSIMENPQKSAQDYRYGNDYSHVLDFVKGAEVLYFGYGSWWNEVENAANIDLSKVNFRLADGTVVLDQLTADQDLVEALGGSVAPRDENEGSIKIEAVDVEIFDMNSVKYEGLNVIWVAAAYLFVVILLAIGVVFIAIKKRAYPEI